MTLFKSHINTSRFHNEILKQRLGCIPIHIKEKDTIDNLLIELNIDNDTDSISNMSLQVILK